MKKAQEKVFKKKKRWTDGEIQEYRRSFWSLVTTSTTKMQAGSLAHLINLAHSALKHQVWLQGGSGGAVVPVCVQRSRFYRVDVTNFFFGHLTPIQL